jgi:acyl carrier protein
MADTPSRDEVLERVKALLVEQKLPGAENATAETTWEELEADSLDLVELVRALEDDYDVQIADSELDGVETVGDAADMLLRVSGAQS